MTIAALIDELTGKVINRIELEPGANWESPQGYFVRYNQNVNIGDSWDGQQLIRFETGEVISNE